jgi:hypothetical protein
MLLGIKPKLEFKEIDIKMNPVHKKVFHYHVNGSGEIDQNDKNHKIMKVTLSDGNEYALDLAGAQYGQLRPAMPLPTYERDYADEWNTVWQNFMSKAVSIDLGGGPRVSSIGQSVIAHLAVKTAEWEKNHKMTVAALLNEKQPVFETKKDALVQKLSNEMGTHVKALLYNGLIRIGKR